jgi:hypothetical protein
MSCCTLHAVSSCFTLHVVDMRVLQRPCRRMAAHSHTPASSSRPAVPAPIPLVYPLAGARKGSRPPARCALSAVYCQPGVVRALCCMPHAARCLSVACCMPHAVCCMLHVACRTLSVGCMLHAACCLSVACCMPHAVCRLHVACRTLCCVRACVCVCLCVSVCVCVACCIRMLHPLCCMLHAPLLHVACFTLRVRCMPRAACCMSPVPSCRSPPSHTHTPLCASSMMHAAGFMLLAVVVWSCIHIERCML